MNANAAGQPALIAFLVTVLLATDRGVVAGGVDRPSTAPTFRAYQHPVTTWVAPYAVAESKAKLFNQPGVKAALTHLALQFWVPTDSGRIELVKKHGATESAVVELRDWAHANGIRTMLCVYNAGGGKWDWPLARAAFAKNGEAFAKNLIAEVKRLRLVGVDMDPEGNGDFESDKAAFVKFMTNLSKRLRDRGKHLTVDTFSYKWNAPNQTWWPELLPLVDGLTTMGYESIGASGVEWKSYAAQRDAAGAHVAKLQIGMPSSKDKWQGNTALEQVKWVQTDGKTGVAIWDAQFKSAAWRTPEVWAAMKAIRGN
jgi:hypothetical protein